MIHIAAPKQGRTAGTCAPCAGHAENGGRLVPGKHRALIFSTDGAPCLETEIIPLRPPSAPLSSGLLRSGLEGQHRGCGGQPCRHNTGGERRQAHIARQPRGKPAQDFCAMALALALAAVSRADPRPFGERPAKRICIWSGAEAWARYRPTCSRSRCKSFRRNDGCSFDAAHRVLGAVHYLRCRRAWHLHPH